MNCARRVRAKEDEMPEACSLVRAERWLRAQFSGDPSADDVEGQARLFDRICVGCGADFFSHDLAPPHECVDTECEGFRAKA